MAKIFPIVVKKVVSGGGGGGASPTVVLRDQVGKLDAIALTYPATDTTGVADTQAQLQFTPTDITGCIDAVTSITASMIPSDSTGVMDATPILELRENAQNASGTPDADAWGDAWVDRTAINAGTHQANGANLTVSAVTAITQQDAFIEINFKRFTSLLHAASGTSTITLTIQWPTVVATPSTNLHVDLQSNASKPFVESTITANTQARFTSAGVYSQRTFAFPQDGTLRTHVITLTAAEVDDILNNNWLLLMVTVPDLTGGVFAVHARRTADATVERYDIFATR